MKSADHSVLIVNAGEADLPVIYQLFEEAILFIKANNYIGWTSYDKLFIQKDIRQQLLYKVVTGGEIICFFSVCYSDALIWREKEKGDAIYLHRIVLNRKYKGVNAFQLILNWANEHAIVHKLRYIRMDTWAENEKIIGYYKKYGFRFLENYTTSNTEDLPVQHRNLTVALLEYPVK